MSLTSEQLLNHIYYKKLPQVYRDMDSTVDYSLKRYLSAIVEGGYGELLQDINKTLELIDPQRCPEQFLPYLYNSFGFPYFEDIDPIYHRRFLSNIGEIIKRRGTYSCVTYLVRALTGLKVTLTYIEGEYDEVEGNHLILNLVVSSIDGANNISTSVTVIERFLATQIPYFITPHINYVPDMLGNTEIRGEYFTGTALTQSKQYILNPPLLPK